MISAEALDALLEAGATAEMIVATVKAELKSANVAADERKMRDAARKRRERQRLKDAHDVRDVRRTPQDKLDKKEKHPPNEYISNPPEKKKTPSSPKGDGSPKRKVRISSSWVAPNITDASNAQKVVDGWPPGKAGKEEEKFIAYHTAKGTLSHNWQANWRTWVLNNEKFGNENRANKYGNNHAERICDPMVRAVIATQT